MFPSCVSSCAVLLEEWSLADTDSVRSLPGTRDCPCAVTVVGLAFFWLPLTQVLCSQLHGPSDQVLLSLLAIDASKVFLPDHPIKVLISLTKLESLM